jgi:hypothetical protein
MYKLVVGKVLNFHVFRMVKTNLIEFAGKLEAPSKKEYHMAKKRGVFIEPTWNMHWRWLCLQRSVVCLLVNSWCLLADTQIFFIRHFALFGFVTL